MKSSKRIFVVLAVAMLMFSFVLATSYAVNVPKNEKKDTGIIIDSKTKTISYKITWNANGGKIGAKKTITTSVKKGSKIGSLASTPKRSGYIFKGWYTKKSGGTKITKNINPSKSASYYAHWKVTSSSQVDEKSKLVGTWYRYYSASSYRIDYYIFYDNGKFTYITGGVSSKSGNYKVSSGKIAFTNVVETCKLRGNKEAYPNTVAEYRFEKNPDPTRKDYLNIALLAHPDKSYLPLDGLWGRWIKSGA